MKIYQIWSHDSESCLYGSFSTIERAKKALVNHIKEYYKFSDIEERTTIVDKEDHILYSVDYNSKYGYLAEYVICESTLDEFKG